MCLSYWDTPRHITIRTRLCSWDASLSRLRGALTSDARTWKRKMPLPRAAARGFAMKVNTLSWQRIAAFCRSYPALQFSSPIKTPQRPKTWLPPLRLLKCLLKCLYWISATTDHRTRLNCQCMPMLIHNIYQYLTLSAMNGQKTCCTATHLPGTSERPSTSGLRAITAVQPVLLQWQHIKIAGKWMFIPLKMVLIGIDP